MNKILLLLGFVAFVAVAWMLVGAPGREQLNLPGGDDTHEYGATELDFKVAENKSAGKRTLSEDNTLMNMTEQKNTPIPAPDELVIETLKEGEGDEIAKNGDTLSVHYVGNLLSGAKFDSSRDRGTPFTFTLGAGQVIKGWDQGMLGMKVGESRKLTIPASLGYGSRGAGGGVIPPNATLVFEVELISID
jgi:FKBP-type peptidyl-prolyl cis-trans isomerase FkpA